MKNILIILKGKANSRDNSSEKLTTNIMVHIKFVPMA